MRVDTEEKCPAEYVGKPPFCEPTTPTPTPTPVERAPGKATVEQGAPPGVEEPTVVLTPTPDEGLLPPPPTTDEQPLPR